MSAFEFSERDDQGNASWVLVDLGQMMPINRVSIYTSAGSRIKNIDLKGGLHPQKLKTILSKRPINSPHFDFTSPLVRYVRVGFWGTKVKVDDIRFIGSLNGEAYLSAEPNTQYRLLYGSPEPLIQYKQQVKTRQTDLRRVNLARESQNKFFVEDFDGDGLSQANDNCPYVSNPSQWDTDKDKIGNKCDNAPKVKNYNQSDIDRDGIGDLADNCKLAPNPDQSNVDKDEYGDACDYAYGKEPLSSAEQASLNFKISIWGILILLFAGIITWQETKNKKISRWINKLKK